MKHKDIIKMNLDLMFIQEKFTKYCQGQMYVMNLDESWWIDNLKEFKINCDIEMSDYFLG